MSTRKQKAFASVRISVIFDWNKDFIIVGGATVNNIRNMSKMHTLTLEQTKHTHKSAQSWCDVWFFVLKMIYVCTNVYHSPNLHYFDILFGDLFLSVLCLFQVVWIFYRFDRYYVNICIELWEQKRSRTKDRDAKSKSPI